MSVACVRRSSWTCIWFQSMVQLAAGGKREGQPECGDSQDDEQAQHDKSAVWREHRGLVYFGCAKSK